MNSDTDDLPLKVTVFTDGKGNIECSVRGLDFEALTEGEKDSLRVAIPNLCYGYSLGEVMPWGEYVAGLRMGEICLLADYFSLDLRKRLKRMAKDYEPEIARLYQEGRPFTARWNVCLAWGCGAKYVFEAPIEWLREYFDSK